MSDTAKLLQRPLMAASDRRAFSLMVCMQKNQSSFMVKAYGNAQRGKQNHRMVWVGWFLLYLKKKKEQTRVKAIEWVLLHHYRYPFAWSQSAFSLLAFQQRVFNLKTLGCSNNPFSRQEFLQVRCLGDRAVSYCVLPHNQATEVQAAPGRWEEAKIWDPARRSQRSMGAHRRAPGQPLRVSNFWLFLLEHRLKFKTIQPTHFHFSTR